tara:strand:+ start:317 stop:523 length:207 start_codon:yes stop_codon:yes gene_type:complete
MKATGEAKAFTSKGFEFFTAHNGSGHVVGGSATEDGCNEDCAKRNAKAEGFGIKARYVVVPKSDVTFV